MRDLTISDTITLVKRALHLLDYGNSWIRKTMYADVDGEATNLYSPETCKYCALGAIIKSSAVDKLEGTYENGWSYYPEVRDCLYKVLNTKYFPYEYDPGRNYHIEYLDAKHIGNSLTYYNDCKAKSFIDIKAVFEETIKELEKRRDDKKRNQVQEGI